MQQSNDKQKYSVVHNNKNQDNKHQQSPKENNPRDVVDFFQKRKSEKQNSSKNVNNLFGQKDSPVKKRVETREEKEAKLKAREAQKKKEAEEAKEELVNFLKKRREEMRRSGPEKNADIIIVAGEKNKNEIRSSQNNQNYQNKNNFPEMILYQKKYGDGKDERKDEDKYSDYIESDAQKILNNLNEDQYNQNRLLNSLSHILEGSPEDQGDDGDLDQRGSIQSKQPNEREDLGITGEEKIEKEIPLSPSEDKAKTNEFVSDYSELEVLKIELEKNLGMDLFKTVYHYVDSTTDPKEVKFDKKNLTEKLETDLGNCGKYTSEDISKAIDKIDEVFTLVAKERISNMN